MRNLSTKSRSWNQVNVCHLQTNETKTQNKTTEIVDSLLGIVNLINWLVSKSHGNKQLVSLFELEIILNANWKQIKYNKQNWLYWYSQVLTSIDFCLLVSIDYICEYILLAHTLFESHTNNILGFIHFNSIQFKSMLEMKH